jgi:tRNA-dihydrouridine synthase 2
MIIPTSLADDHASNAAEIENDPSITPEGTQNPEPPSSGAPFLPADIGRNLPPMLSGQDPMTPTPGGSITTIAI